MNKLEGPLLEEARRMRLAGHSFREIGRTFGVSGDTACAAIDPIYAERRRQWLRESRERVGRKFYVQPKKPAAPPKIKLRKQHHVWSLTSPVGRELGIRAISVSRTVPSYALGTIGKSQTVTISLPYLPTLYGRAKEFIHAAD